MSNYRDKHLNPTHTQKDTQEFSSIVLSLTENLVSANDVDVTDLCDQ